MAKDEQKEERNDDTEAGNLVKFSGIAFQMIVIIGIFTYAGYKIDAANHHNVKWVTAILSLIGVFISLYIVIRSVKRLVKIIAMGFKPIAMKKDAANYKGAVK